MNVEAVKQVMIENYPSVNIKQNANPTGEITEIVGEIDRKLVDSERDVAVVVADRSAEHWHEYTTEQYEVLRGMLHVYLNGVLNELTEGEKITVEPGTRHWVEGNETWFYCFSDPDWTPEDFHLVEKTAQ